MTTTTTTSRKYWRLMTCFSGGYKCTDPNWYRVSQDAQGCHPPHRDPWDLRRLLGNKPLNHTNEMCSFRKSASCQQQRRRGRDPRTFEYRTSDTPLFRRCRTRAPRLDEPFVLGVLGRSL